MLEDDLIRKLQSIEALFAGATTDGERVAAGLARERILARLKEVAKVDPPREYKFTCGDQWSTRLFIALLRRYGIKPYRYRRQRHTTVMAKVSVSFVDQTLWPEFVELDRVLRTHLNDVTHRIIRQGIHEDSTEPEVRDEAKTLKSR